MTHSLSSATNNKSQIADYSCLRYGALLICNLTTFRRSLLPSTSRPSSSLFWLPSRWKH